MKPTISSIWIWARRGTATFLMLVLVAAFVGTIYERFAGRRAEMAKGTTPRGELVCEGEGSPIVLFFLGSTVPAVGQLSRQIEPVVGEFAKICRRIYVRSDDWDPPTGERLVAELHDALAAGDVHPPYVLVGWSMGGLAARWFDASYSGEVAGFVFVDSSHPDMVNRPAYVPQWSPLGLPSWAGSVLRKTGVLRLMLTERLPPWLTRPIEGRRGARQELAGYFVDHQIVTHTRQLSWEDGSLGQRPVVVLTKDVYSSESDRTSWMEFQNEFAALSSATRPQVVDGSEHAIWASDPEAVTEAIREVVELVRAGER